MTTTDDKTPGPTPALLSAARLAEIRERASSATRRTDGSHDGGIAGRAMRFVDDDVPALLAHIDALAPRAVDGDALGFALFIGDMRETDNHATREAWAQMEPDPKAEYVSRALAIHAIGHARGRAEGLEGIDRWKMIAEGKDVRIAVLRDEIARLTAELAEARAAVESFQRGSGCIDGYTIGEALAKIGASLDRTPTEGIPDAIARLKRAAETARREGAREEREAAIAELTVLRNGSDARADERIIAFDEAIDCLRQRASDEPTPVEGEDGAT